MRFSYDICRGNEAIITTSAINLRILGAIV